MEPQRQRSALRASASAPVLPRDVGGGAYVRSERVERTVPPLALVPLDQLQQLQRRRRRAAEAPEEAGAEIRGSDVDHRLRHHKAMVRQARRSGTMEDNSSGEEEEEERQRQRKFHRLEQQQRLGERFLGMMALLARLRRMDLEKPGASATHRHQPQRSSSAERRSLSPQRNPQRSVSPGRRPKPASLLRVEAEAPASTALEKLVAEKQRAERSVFAQGGVAAVRAALALSPRKKPEPVENVATKPLREHLTFEISMLLPAPMDTRQSALRSPIERQPQRVKKKRRRRRRRRPTGAVRVDGKRTWQTSHVTWVAHASADYAQARAAESAAATAGSKLVAKFASLRTAATATAGPSTYLYATDKQGPPRRTEARRQPGERSERRMAPSREDEEEEDAEEEEERPEEEPTSVFIQEDGDEDAGEEEDEEEDGAEDDEHSDAQDDSDDDDDADAHERADRFDAPPSALGAAVRSAPFSSSSTSSGAPRLRPVQTHQAAWISPELRAWLVRSGLFRTAARPPPPLQ